MNVYSCSLFNFGLLSVSGGRFLRECRMKGDLVARIFMYSSVAGKRTGPVDNILNDDKRDGCYCHCSCTARPGWLRYCLCTGVMSDTIANSKEDR